MILLYLILWLLMITWGGEFHLPDASSAFNKQNTLALRGICAFEIMLGHIGGATGEMILYPNRKAGILFVGVFFALSGYGLMYSVAVKPGYLDYFFTKRMLWGILLKAYFVYAVSVLVNVWQTQQISQMMYLIDPRRFFVQTNWYVWEILIFYLWFYFSVKFWRSKILVSTVIFSVFFVAMAFVSGIDNPWYGSTLCFALGICLFKMSNRLEHFLLKYYNIILLTELLTAGSMILLFYVLGNDSIAGNPIARNMASVAFTAFCFCLLSRLKVGNKVSFWMGKYSYEIFLVHLLAIEWFRNKAENSFLYATAVIGTTLIGSWILGRLIPRKSGF